MLLLKIQLYWRTAVSEGTYETLFWVLDAVETYSLFKVVNIKSSQYGINFNVTSSPPPFFFL